MTELELLLRTLASPSRLRILAILFEAWESDPDARRPALRTSPSILARTLGLSRSSVTHHLKALQRLRLIRFWKLHRSKFYTLCRVHKGSLRWRLLDRLRDEIPRGLPPVPVGPARGVRGVRIRPRRHAGASTGPLSTLWSALTCFSHFRRILFLEHLRKAGRATREELADAADIHPFTARYHVRKLIKRGVLTEISPYRFLPEPLSPLHGFLFRLVDREIARFDPGRRRGRPRAWPSSFAAPA